MCFGSLHKVAGFTAHVLQQTRADVTSATPLQGGEREGDPVCAFFVVECGRSRTLLLLFGSLLQLRIVAIWIYFWVRLHLIAPHHT